MAIPLKFRRPVEGMRAQTEAGPTLALAPGLKHSWNKYKGTKNALGKNTTSVSVSFGGLAGLGVVDVNAKSTLSKVSDTDATKNAIIPLGFHLVGGVNTINVGVAVGWDVITGPNASHWVYKGQMWTGVIVGIDIIK